MQNRSAGKFLERFSSRKVLVVGDAMLDRFIWGEVDRISPEAPVPVVKVRTETARLGGAANVAANIAALGATAVLTGVVGRDAAGEEIAAALLEAGVDGRLVVDPSRATTVKSRVIARAQQVVRVDREGDGLLGRAENERLLDTVRGALEEVDAVVVSDYAKGVITDGLLASLLPEGLRRKLPVIVDPKPARFFRYQPSTVVTPNQNEAGFAAGIEIRSDEDCLAAVHALLGRLDTKAILVTRGERGMLLQERGAAPRFIPAVAREVYDVTGAGDTVAGVLGVSLAAGAGLAEAAILANHAAGIVVGKVGTSAVTLEELRGTLSEATV